MPRTPRPDGPPPGWVPPFLEPSSPDTVSNSLGGVGDQARDGITAPEVSSVLTSTLGFGDNLIHGLIYYNGNLWASTRTAPARVLKIDPTTLGVASRRILTDTIGLDYGEDIEAANGYIWTVLYTNPARLVRVDPTTLAVQITSFTSPNFMSAGASLDYSFGKLWVGGLNSVAEVDITNPNSPLITVHNYSALRLPGEDFVLATALSHSATYLYASFTQGTYAGGYHSATIARIDPATPGSGYLSTNLTTLFPDDMVYHDGHLYNCSEYLVHSDCYRFLPDLSANFSVVGYTTDVSYGTFSNPGDLYSFWASFKSTPGKIKKFDLLLNELWSFDTPAGTADPSEIVFDSSGNMYVSTFQSAARMIRYTPPDPVTVSISKSGNDVVLSWTNSDSLVDHYEVWSSTNPYFIPGDTGSTKVDIAATMGAMNYTAVGALGNVSVHHFYVVRAFNDFGLTSAISNRVGEVEYELRETAGSDLNWIALPLDASLVMASNLANNIQSNSTGSITVVTIEQWNSIGQNYQTHVIGPPPSGDFSVQVGNAYRVSVNVTVGSTVVWALLGNVPSPPAFSYTLRETAGSDLNWIMLPPNKININMASGLKSDIDTTANPATTALTVERWNAIGQNYQTYAPPSGDFAVQIGNPLRVTVNVLTGSTSTWP